MKPGKTGIVRLLYAIRYSKQGLNAAWKYEAAFRQDVLLLLTGSAIACFLPVSLMQFLAMVCSLLFVVIVELVNSAIEAVVDRFGGEHHELSGRAKDIGSAAVLLALIQAALVWGCILYGVFFFQ